MYFKPFPTWVKFLIAVLVIVAMVALVVLTPGPPP